MILALTTIIRLLILPLSGTGPDAAVADEATRILREVAAVMKGVSSPSAAEFEQAMAGEAGKVWRRCGNALDCRLKVAGLLSAQVLVVGSASSLGESAVVELQVLDVGTGVIRQKVSRTLAGSRIQRAAALEAVLIEALFPERLVGTLEITLDPPGGTLFLDGNEKQKNAPATLRLAEVREGQHTLRVVKPGYCDFFAVVQVPYLGTSRIEIAMRPQLKSGGEAVPGRP